MQGTGDSAEIMFNLLDDGEAQRGDLLIHSPLDNTPSLFKSVVENSLFRSFNVRCRSDFFCFLSSNSTALRCVSNAYSFVWGYLLG